MARLVTISKVSVGNLPLPWSAEWETRYFKVTIFCAGLGVEETRPEQLDSDGCIEWTEPLQLSMRGIDESLVAIVFSSRPSGGDSWYSAPDCRFEGFPVKMGHSVWRPPSTHPGAGVSFRAEVETVLDKDKSQGAAELGETFAKRDENQGAAERLETSFEGEKFQGADEHLDTRLEEDRSQGGDGRQEYLSQADKSQAAAERLEKLVADEWGAEDPAMVAQEYNNLMAFWLLERLIERAKMQGAEEHPEFFLLEDKRQGTAERLDTLSEIDTRQGTAEHLEMLLDGGTSERVAEPPPTPGRESSERVHSHPVVAGNDGTDESRTVLVSARDSNSAVGTRRAVEGRSWLARHEALISSLTGRNSTYTRTSPASRPPSSERWSTLIREGSSTSARGRDSSIYARRSVGTIDQSMPKSALPSLSPDLETHVMPALAESGELVPKRASASVLRFSSSGASRSPAHSAVSSSASHPTGAQRFMSVVKPPSEKRKVRAVYTSPAVSTTPPSYEEVMQAKWSAMRSLDTEVPLPPDVEIASRSPAQSSLPALPEVEAGVAETLRLPESPAASGADAPPPSYDSIVAQTPLHSPVPASLTQRKEKLRESRDGRLGVYRSGLQSISLDCDMELESTRCLTINASRGAPPQALPASSEEVPFCTEVLMPRGESSPAERCRPQVSASRVAAAVQAPSPKAVEAASRPQTPIVQPINTSADIEDADPVYIMCVSPRYVFGGCGFQLRVSASLRRVQGDKSRAISREGAEEGATEAGMPRTMRIGRGKRVTVTLELPENVFKVLDPDRDAASEVAINHPPSVQDFVWNGIGQDAVFDVICLAGAAPGAVDYGVRLVEGDSATRSSCRIEIEQGEHTSDSLEICDANDGYACVEEAEACVGEDNPSEPTISGTVERVHGVQKLGPITEEDTAGPIVPRRPSVVFPPAPFLLSSRVDPGPSVHESKEHGFRLTIQDGSLHSPIGPISIQHFAQVVKCESDGQDYLVKTVVDCLPSGAKFPDKPLFMDFMIEDAASYTKISKMFEVLVRKGGAGGWKTIKSKVRVDQWGTYLRAAVSDFCHFTWGTKVNPSDPARLESCDKRGVIEVQNATEEEVYFVLVPVSFDPEKTSRVTYTGNIAFGVAGLSFGAAGGSGYESAVKSHMLPAGFTPDDISVAAGGKFQFLPPPGSSQGKLLVATITEDSQAGLSVKVVVLHGKFNTPEGKRRVILPICLQSKSRISARLGPNDVPVNMVMIMAGLGSTATTITEVISPQSSTSSVATPSTVVSAAVPPRTGQSRGSTMRSCPIS